MIEVTRTLLRLISPTKACVRQRSTRSFECCFLTLMRSSTSLMGCAVSFCLLPLFLTVLLFLTLRRAPLSGPEKDRWLRYKNRPYTRCGIHTCVYRVFLKELAPVYWKSFCVDGRWRFSFAFLKRCLNRRVKVPEIKEFISFTLIYVSYHRHSAKYMEYSPEDPPSRCTWLIPSSTINHKIKSGISRRLKTTSNWICQV